MIKDMMDEWFKVKAVHRLLFSTKYRLDCNPQVPSDVSTFVHNCDPAITVYFLL